MKFSIVSYIKNKEADKLRKELKEKFNVNLSLTHWKLHITMGNGIYISKSKLKQIRKELIEVSSKFNPFKVEFKGFGYMSFFPSYAVYVKVKQNRHLLKLHKEVNNVLTNYKTWYKIKIYIPHLTLAYGDVTKNKLKKIKEFLKNKDIYFSYKIDSFSLAMHRGFHERRKSYMTFKFKNI